jgi:hypothetical protein
VNESYKSARPLRRTTFVRIVKISYSWVLKDDFHILHRAFPRGSEQVHDEEERSLKFTAKVTEIVNRRLETP